VLNGASRVDSRRPGSLTIELPIWEAAMADRSITPSPFWWQGGSRGSASARTLDEARDDFFTALQQKTPLVLERLSHEPFRAYCDYVTQSGGQSALFAHDMFAHEVKAGSATEFTRPLLAWAGDCCLKDAWCVDRAVDTLDYWHWWASRYEVSPNGYDPALDPDRCWGRLPMMKNVSEFVHNLRPPQLLPSGHIADYLEQKRLFDQRLREYHNRVLSLHPERALLRKKNWKHLHWLALFQSGDMEAIDIADCYSTGNAPGVNVDSVRDAITRTARLLGLTKRPARQGPPTRARRPHARVRH
jgi:hypothetical protein